MKKILLASITAIALGSTAFASTNIYFGGGIGYSNYETGISNIRGGDLDENDKSYQFLVGTDLNKYFAIETEYNNFGEATYDFTNGDSFQLGNYNYTAITSGKIKTEAKTLGMSILFKYPLNRYIIPFVKGGYHAYEHKAETATQLGTSISKSTGGDYHYGTGIESQISKNITTRLAYDNYSFDEEHDLNNISCSIIFKF